MNFLKRFLLFILTLFATVSTYGQVKNDFEPRYNTSLRGDLTIVANNIVNRESGSKDANDPYNETGNSSTSNDSWDMQYIDIDGDASTFSSSSATLTVPDTDCSKIRYAGLYWSAVYANETDRSNIGDIKFKTPSGAYLDITADEVLFDGYGDSDFDYYSPYACYKDITSIVTALADPNGDYTAANIRASVGEDPSGGVSGGWTMVVVYENPTYSGKYITTFDGYAGIKSGESVDIPVSGFTTLPAPFPVNARLGVSTLEGDNRISGDGLSIKSNSVAVFTPLGNTINPSTNFFNANITFEDNIVTTRYPNSINTLGWDADLFTIPNPGTSVIPNDETGAVLRASSSQDKYDIFFTSFDVEIIEPKINLAKRVEDIGGNDITGLGVNLGQTLEYVLSFQNVGNDDADNYTIKDILPLNVTLDETNITYPTGVTYTYDPSTRIVLFSIPNNLVKKEGATYSIRMRVKVAENCFDFINACSDLIQNLAYSTYQGVLNDNQITDDPSVTDFDNCGFTTPGATNFLLDDLEDCDYNRTVQLCGDDVLLDAGDNFDDYIWYKDENNNGVIDGADTILNDGDSDTDLSTLLVNDIGIYIVDKIVADPCKGFQEIITVERFGTTQTNPISALINDTSNTVEGEITVCPIDGDPLPKIFLCGLNDVEPVTINIPDATSIYWEKLDEASCGASVEDCANKNGTCTWARVESGSTLLASDPGQYRVIINYQNGCFSRFYFNVFKNPLDPKATISDIICTTPGNITVTNIPANYEFQLLNAATDAVIVPFSANNGPSFSIANNGAYTVEIRQQGVVDGCLFRLEDLGVLRRDYKVNITTKDTNCTGLGEIRISAEDVEPQYYFEVSQGGVPIDTYGPTDDNDYTFTGLNDGVYDVTVTTDDGCTYTEEITINDLSDLDLTARISQHITCKEGNIQMESTGGRTPYSYAIWSFVDETGTTVTSYPSTSDIPVSEYQTSVIFDVLIPGDYTFVMIDKNNCSTISNTVTIVLVPSVEYTSTIVDESCFGAEDGSYAVDMISSNGYKVDYELEYPDGTIIANQSGSFTNLPQGDYTVTLIQSKGGSTCEFVETFTIGGPTSGVTGTAVLTQDYTCLQEATIEVQNVIGGEAPYTYSIDGVNFVGPAAGAEIFSSLTNGTYSITIRDANLCTFVTNEITIAPLNEPTDLDFTATAPNCSTQTSDVAVTVANGTAPFTFEIIAPAAVAATNTTGNTATFTDLAPDTYTFMVTDAKGCTFEESFTIRPVDLIHVSGSLVRNITCFDDTDGEATFTVSGFNSTYNYIITGPTTVPAGTAVNSTSIPLTNLDNGTYTITVTDTATNCTATADVVIAAPTAALTLSANETQPTCTADGRVILTANGGWGGNDFTITYPDATTTVTNGSGTFNNLNQAGTYTVSVEDANGCIATASFILDVSVAPTLAITPNTTCFTVGAGLELTASVTAGGDGNYQYRLNGGAYGTNAVFSGLNPGTYTIDVIDGKNCTATAVITVNPELTVTAAADNITACATDTNVTITAAGGDGTNYVYAIVSNGVTPNAGDFTTTNPRTITTGAGNYDVYVRDNNGTGTFCEAKFDITIAQDAPLTVSTASTDILCSGESQSTITITAGGGEAPYRYSIDGGANYQPTNTFPNLAAGSYSIRVRDANNCEVTDTHTITEPFTLSASAAVTALYECNPSTGAEVRITNAQGGTPNYEYSFDGGTNYNTNPINYLLPGTHTLFIRDANLCTFQMTVTVDSAPIAPTFAPSISYDCDGLGEITITSNSTDFDYIYAIDGTENTPNTSNLFNDVPSGNHTITVDYTSNIAPVKSTLLLEDFGTGPNVSIPQIDATYYCYESQDLSLGTCTDSNFNINDLQYSVTQEIVAPFGSWRSPNDASLTPNGRFLAVNVGDPGVNTIVYSKKDIEIIPNRNVEVSLAVFNLVKQGTNIIKPNVLVEIVDPLGNIIDSGTTGPIDENTGPNDWKNISIPSLDPGTNSTIDIIIRTIATGTNGNDVAIDDIQAFQLPEVCSSTATFDVMVEAGKAFAADITNPKNISCFGGTDGEFVINAANFGAGGFEYTIDGGTTYVGPFTASTTVNTLTAQNYTIEVRDVDDTTCSIPLTQELTEPAALSASNTLIQPTCDVDGTVEITVSGGTAGFTYEIEQPNSVVLGPQSQNMFTGLNQLGLHTITITDANGCTTTDTFTTIAPTTPTISVDPSSDLCYSSSSLATIVITATGGVSPYYYSINNGPLGASNTFTDLIPGNYTFEVTDENGCSNSLPFTIQPELTANAVLSKDLDCTLSPDAEISLNVTGGYSPYTYEISVDGAAYASYTGAFPYVTAAAGTYQFRVTDVQNCISESNIITVSTIINPTATENVTEPTCNGDANGIVEIIVDPTTGVSPYEINFDGAGFSSQKVYPGLAAGTYTYVVRDDKDCIYNGSVTLTDPVLFDADVVATDISCGGSGDILGSIAITITSGGEPSFTYTLYDNQNNLATTTSPNPINTSSTSVSFDGLGFGDYYVRVIDAKGCEYYENPVRVLSNPYLSVNAIVNSDCAVGGSVELSSEGGSGDYTFTIYDTAIGPDTEVNGPAADEETATFLNLNIGQTYVFQVIDDVTGCSSYLVVDIPPASAIAVVPDPVITDVTCFGDTNGSIEFQIEGYDPTVDDIEYSLLEALTNNPVVSATNNSGTLTNTAAGPGPSSFISITDIPPGDYILFFKEGSSPNCSNTYSFRILEPTAVDLSLIDNNNGNCNTDAQITVLATGGTGPYTYAFVQDNVLPIPSDYTTSNYAELDILTDTDWDVYVLDAKGCASATKLDVAIANDPSPVFALTVPNQCTGAEGTYEIDVELTTVGVGPYKLSFNGGAFQTTTLTNLGDIHTFTNLSSGTHTVRIRDFNGCEYTDSIIIMPPTSLNAKVTTQPTCLGSDGAIVITPFGGSGLYGYRLYNNDSAAFTGPIQPIPTFTGLVAGSYTAFVYDNTLIGCEASVILELEIPTPVSFTTSSMDVSCFGGNDGTITVTLDSGMDNPPYTYELFDSTGLISQGATQSSNIFTNLAANDYTVRVFSGRGCFSDIPETVGSPATIVINSVDVTEFGCTAGNENNYASITIPTTVGNITGGSGSYVRYVFENTTTATIVQNGPNNEYIETNIAGGSYTITVYDDNGCIGTINTTIEAYDELVSASIIIDEAITCSNAGEDITINVFGSLTDSSTPAGLANYEFRALPSGVIQASNQFTDLAIGDHTFEVRNVNTNCLITVSHKVIDPNTFDITITKLSDVICYGTETGEVTFELTDATYSGPINWVIYNTNGTVDRIDDSFIKNNTFATNGPTSPITIEAGSYLVEIFQVNSPECSNIEAFTIAGPSAAITGATEVTAVTCLGNDGIIEVINPAGGWGDYVYYVDVVGNPAPVLTDYVSNPKFTGLSGAAAPAGTDYQVWIADKNGCVFQLPNENLVTPTPISATLQVNQENCTNLEGEIEVSLPTGGQGSNYTYQLIKNGTAVGSPQTTRIFSGLGAGSYTVFINDQWSCDFTTLATVLYEEINVSTTVVKPIDCTVDPGGQITVNVTGGSTNLEFVATLPISGSTITNTTGVFTGLTEVGVYSFVVRDLDTSAPICEKTVIQELVDKVDPILLASTVENVSCFGLSDGSITANLDPATNVDPIYNYNLYDATGATLLAGPQTSPTFTGLAAAFYQIEVISAKGCSVRQTVEVTQPTALIISAVATEFACAPNNTVNTATITVTIEDDVTTPGTPSGTSPYLYSIDNVNFQTANTFTVIDTENQQPITVYVTDGNSCPQTTNVVIEPINKFTAVVTQDAAISCVGPEEITITVTDNGDATNVYSYQLLPIGNTNGTQTATPTYNTATYNVTAVGGYVFRVTDTATGCYVDTEVYNIAQYDLIKVSATATSPVTCFGDIDGEIEVTVTDATGPFMYTVLNADGTLTGINGNATINTFTIPGLSGGNYYVAVTEDNAPFCTEDSNVITIISPSMALTASITQTAAVTCDNNAGEIFVNPNGGYAPYDIVLTNTTTSAIYTATDVLSTSFFGLSAGTYTVEVTDNGGCEVTDTIIVDPAIPITADITPLTQMLTCFGDSNGSVSAINVVGGQSVYQYQLNVYDATGTSITSTSGGQTSNTFNNLGAGIYTITISDGWNCDVETVQAIITEPTDITGSLVQVSELTCVDPAEIQLTATGGTAPYEFSVDGISYTPMTGGDTHRFIVIAGVYQYYIKDAFNCGNIISNLISIDAVPPLTIVLDESAAVINCNGESTATINSRASGGLGNYSYELLDSPTSSTPIQGPQTNGEFRNLAIGTYYVKVTSDGGCEEVSRAITITEPDPLVIDLEDATDITCAGENDGTITVEVSGGTGEIKYAISPNLNQFDTKNVFTNLEPGTYDVIAQDKNGCFITFNFTINEPTAIQLSATTTGETCTGNEDGMATVTITGGTAPYSTSLDSNDPADYVLDRIDFSGLSSGSHVILVKDANGCDTNIVIEIEPGVNLKATATPIYECSTDTPTNYLEVVFEDSATGSDVLYGLDTTEPSEMQLTSDFTNMSAGDHYLFIMHANGCTETINFAVEGFDPLTLVLTNSNINEITATVTGGNPNYTFYIQGNNNGEENTFRIRETDTYTIVVVDENGCEVSQDIFIEFIDIEVPNFFTPDGDLIHNTWEPKNTEGFPNILTIIYDRYGRELYRMGMNDTGWDGIYDSKELPSGDYWYTIKLKGENDDREFVGHFTLYR